MATESVDEILHRLMYPAQYVKEDAKGYPVAEIHKVRNEAKAALQSYIAQHTKEAVDKKLASLEESIRYMGLCEEDSNKVLTWARNHRWSLIAPEGENTAAPQQSTSPDGEKG